MRHAVLGAGGIGGLLAGALAHAGRPVTLLVRRESLERSPADLTVSSPSLGTFTVRPARAVSLVEPVDVVWLTVKSTALPAALDAVTPEALGAAVIVPLLNGIDHVQLLRERYGSERVIAATIRTGAVRVAPGEIEHRGWHTGPGRPVVELAAPGSMAARAGAIAVELIAAGVPAGVNESEPDVLWSKLVEIVALGLGSGAAGSVAELRADPTVTRLVDDAITEAVAVAAAEGASVDGELIRARLAAADGAATSSLRLDVEHGRPNELDALAGPVIRLGRAHGIDVRAIEHLRALVAQQAAAAERP